MMNESVVPLTLDTVSFNMSDNFEIKCLNMSK